MEKEFIAEKEYLELPVPVTGAGSSPLRIYEQDKLVYEFMIPGMQEGEGAVYHAALPLLRAGECGFDTPIRKGDRLRLVFEGGKLPGEIRQTDHPEIPEAPAYELHYTAPYGWLNDPNGMIFYKGCWHLYHQHNPFATVWDNMSWAHAVSEDLIHFRFHSDVLFQDDAGMIFSGCAIKNDRGCFGLPEDAILYFYTSAGGVPGRPELASASGVPTQRMAYSLDGGRTLIKYRKWELSMLARENRDPKVFLHEESGAYIMVLYLIDNRFRIFRSDDLENWEQTDELDMPPMWECPDLFRVRNEEGESAWAFMSADGYYYMGDFDGYRFTKKGNMRKLYADEIPYAAQSFSGTGARVISMAWLRLENRGEPYTGAMSVAREFSLGRDEEGSYIKQAFVPEAEAYVLTGDDGSKRIEDCGITEWIDPEGRLLHVEIR